MKMMASRIAFASSLTVFCCVFLIAPRTSGQQKGDQRQTKQKSKQPAQPEKLSPYALHELFELLLDKTLRKQADSLVEKLGVDPSAKAGKEVIDLLRKLGASEKLLSVVPKDEPPPPEFAGDLTVRCKPDCEVRVGNRFFGETAAGVIQIVKQLPPGEVEVVAAGRGLKQKSVNRTLQKGAPLELNFELEATQESKDDASRQRLLKILNAIGSSRGLVESSHLKGQGQLNLWATPERSPITVSFTFNSSPASIRAEFSLGNQACVVGSGIPSSCKGRGPKLPKKRGAIAPAEERKTLEDVAAAVQLFHDNSLWSLFSEFYEGKAKLSEDETGRPRKIEYSRGGTSYAVELEDYRKAGAAAMHPAKIAITPGPGAYARLSVTLDSIEPAQPAPAR